MKYKLHEKHNPLQPEAPKKWYPTAVNAGKITIKDFARELAGRSSLTRGDIQNVLDNFLDELPTFLKLGMSVQMGDFGTIRLSLSGEGAETPEAFKPSTITSKIIFTPSIELKESVKKMQYEVSL